MPKSNFDWPVAGHKNIVNYLQKSITTDQVSHAYLFVGPKGIGKTTVTDNFVSSLVCKKTGDNEVVPCRQCDCCRQVENKIHPDVVWVQRQLDQSGKKMKKNISIEQVRELKNKLSLHSFLNSYKVAVISQAESLSQEAANALLKTIEEPTAKTVILILVDNINLIPKTVTSRCQVLRFLPVGRKDIIDYLGRCGIKKKTAETLADLSYGKPGLAINYSLEPDYLNDYKEKIKEFLILKRKEITEKFNSIKLMVGFSDPDSIKEILDIWTKIVRDLILIKNANSYLIGHSYLRPELEELAKSFDNLTLRQLLSEINLSKKYLAANVNPKLILENLILNF